LEEVLEWMKEEWLLNTSKDSGGWLVYQGMYSYSYDVLPLSLYVHLL